MSRCRKCQRSPELPGACPDCGHEMGQPVEVEELQVMEPSAMGVEFPEDLSLGEWTSYGHKILKSSDKFNWLIGDWAAFGNKQFGKLKEFCEANQLKYQTIRNWGSVSASIQMSRRRDNLSWSHHCEVAPLPPKAQDKWLKVASEEHLSIAELRRRIRSETPGHDALVSDGPAVRTIGTKFDEVRGFLLNQPSEFWDDDNKRIWKERLRPVVEFYEKL